MIDAEGHDCQILRSVIDFCSRSSNEHVWPDILQFETMGHCDRLYGDYSEDEMLRCLEDFGYIVVCRGNDTQLVRGSALDAKVRLQHWLDRICCKRCWASGMGCIPFTSYSGAGTMCKNCACLFYKFGDLAWELLRGGAGHGIGGGGRLCNRPDRPDRPGQVRVGPGPRAGRPALQGAQIRWTVHLAPCKAWAELP